MGDVRDLLKTVAVELEARANDDERNMPGDGDGPSTLRKWARQLRAISARDAVPEGWALVPVKPTKFMMDAAIPPGRQDQTGRREFAIWQAMLAAAPQPAGEDAQPEVWINRCPVNHDRRATCPRCESSRPPGAKHGQPVSAPPEPAPSAPAATGKELLQVADAEALAKPMMLEVAFDFADNPRPYHSLACPADTNGELYRALKVLAAEARRLAALAAAKDCLTTADMEGLAKAIFEAHREQYVGTSLWPMRGWDDVEQSTRDHWTHIARRLSGAEQADTLEALNETEKDIAIAQAVEFAQYVVDHAKGRMVEAAERFLSLPYSQEIAQRLTAAQQAAKDGE